MSRLSRYGAGPYTEQNVDPDSAFRSILCDKGFAAPGNSESPRFFADLNLNQIIEAITAPKQEYDLKPFFRAPLRDIETVRYRQEVMQDLQNQPLMTHIKTFSEGMAKVRGYLKMAEKLESDHHRKGWVLEASVVYCSTLSELSQGLTDSTLKSRGLLSFRDYLNQYIQSQGFHSLSTDSQRLKSRLSQVKYSLLVQSGKFKVKHYEGQPDYSIDLEQTFNKFKQGNVKDYMVRQPAQTGMSHIEAKILEFVSKLYPKHFAELDDFHARYSNFTDETIKSFDREIQFYVAYLEFIASLQNDGLPFCYPKVSTTSKGVYLRNGFDLALASSLANSEQTIVPNDFYLNDSERIIVVTGPNQGGKTTFARMFGQIHYLASLGCPVPGSEAQIFLFDEIFTHFEREEDISNLRGKLEDDLIRIHEMLEEATPNSIFVVNELFASTTLQDAVSLSKEILKRVMELDALCVWVTFLDELSSLSEKTVSMVATICPEDPAVRTFRIARQPADGLAYALSLAKKHRLTYEQIKERIP